MRIYRAKERHDEILAEYNAVKTAIDQHLSVWAMLKEKVRKHAVLLLQ